MPERNRVTPTGEIVAIAQRGMFLGNRGCIHRDGAIVRPWQVRRWITCVLSYKGWVAPRGEPGRWTPLFFWDEAVALAAGHRPCALCRHADHRRWLDAWEAAFGERPRADPLDRRLHEARVAGRAQRRHARAWPGLPVGTFVALPGPAPGGGQGDGGQRDGGHGRGGHGDGAVVPALVLADRLVPWSPVGYGPPVDRPPRGAATVLTPAPTVDALAHGYAPVIHPGATG